MYDLFRSHICQLDMGDKTKIGTTLANAKKEVKKARMLTQVGVEVPRCPPWHKNYDEEWLKAMALAAARLTNSFFITSLLVRPPVPAP